jgi:hypothetical protein
LTLPPACCKFVYREEYLIYNDMKNEVNFNLYISYSGLDRELAGRFSYDLKNNGINVLFDEYFPETGEDWQKRLTDTLYNADGIIILITPNSISSRNFLDRSEMVQTYNLKSEVEKLLLPVIFGINEIPEFLNEIQAVYRGADYQECIESITKAVYEFMSKGSEDFFANQAQVKRPRTRKSGYESPVSESDSNGHGGLENGGPEPVKLYGKIYQPFFMTEGDHQKTEDQLDFVNDIDSFASVIALEKVHPPLAIGLFGNWGSGKSFFMEKLSGRIEELTKSGDPLMIKNAVQVKFNSWHYSDTNLWASLTTQIFESLNDYAKEKKFGNDAILELYKDLNITSLQIKETQKQIENNEVQANVIKEQKENIERIIEQKKETLRIWTAKDFIRIVFSDPYIQKDFENIKEQFNEEKLIDNVDQIDEKLSEINTVREQIVESYKLLKTHRRGNWNWIWILAILFALLSFLVFIPSVKNAISQFIDGGYVIAGLIVTWLTNLIAKLSPFFNKVNQFSRRLKSLKEKIEKEKENVRLMESDEIDRLNRDINSLVAENAGLELKQKQIEERKQALEKEISDIGSGRLLANFLARKSEDDAYIKQLGIISWIRKDFRKLDELFRSQKSVQDKEKDIKTELRIDRIILFIDDLDRCNEDVVVKVLEAIHLLLAFPLFVVIVGVDPRWLNNALSEKYRDLFGDGSEKNQRTERNGITRGENPDEQGLSTPEFATSYDYLEKIFQIPFALKPINKTGREQLIKYLMKDEMADSLIKGSSQPVTAQSEQGPAGFSNVNTASSPSDLSADEKPPLKPDEGKFEIAHEKLVFTTSERDYMQSISSLFGKTPRSINRYVNIYRIIKTHGSLKVTGDFSEDDFKPIMFLLAIIVGYSFLAKDFIEKISEAEDYQTFADFVENNWLNKELKSLLKSFTYDVGNLQMKNFKNNLELISRFSFRTLLT